MNHLNSANEKAYIQTLWCVHCQRWQLIRSSPKSSMGPISKLLRSRADILPRTAPCVCFLPLPLGCYANARQLLSCCGVCCMEAKHLPVPVHTCVPGWSATSARAPASIKYMLSCIRPLSILWHTEQPLFSISRGESTVVRWGGGTVSPMWINVPSSNFTEHRQPGEGRRRRYAWSGAKRNYM